MQTEIKLQEELGTSAQLLVTLLSKVKYQHMMHMYLYNPRSVMAQGVPFNGPYVVKGLLKTLNFVAARVPEL